MPEHPSSLGTALLDIIRWSVRRDPAYVVRLYDSLADVMLLATEYTSLNFGLWDDINNTPILAQQNMATHIGKMAELDKAALMADVGCGLSAPAVQWRAQYRDLDTISVDINHQTLSYGSGSNRINGSATSLPLSDDTVDRVVALESAQHFRPLHEFVHESARVLTPGGVLCMAMPVVSGSVRPWSLGMLSVVWFSEHYPISAVRDSVRTAGFDIEHTDTVGSMVYEPLATYYTANRSQLRSRIIRKYPGYIESVLYRSMNSMRKASARGILEYLLLKCRLPQHK